MIRLRLLGGIDLRDAEGREIRPLLAQPKRFALLAYLAAASPRGAHRRDTLLGLFWPELDQEHGRNALSQALRVLRRALGDNALVSRGAEELAIDPELVWCDAAAFNQALDEDRLDEALRLYRGDLLPSYFVEASSGFEEWLERERAALRSRAAGAARRLAERHEAGQQHTAAVAFARRAVELSDGDERPLRRLVELLAGLGDRAGAIRAYEEFARRLAVELELEPAAETLALVQRVRAERADREPPPSPADAPPPRPDTSAAAVQRLRSALAGRYEIDEQIGAGAMAVVVRATDLRHRRRVAIKVLRPELASLMGPERFLREIDIAAGLVHPHILPLHDSGEVDGLLYYVMPCIEGASLRDRLRSEGRLPVADAIRITREIADALEYAHAQGLVHRDIKPENILLNRDHALLADFGIARAVGSGGGEPLAVAQRATGTPAYMSPEQVLGSAPLDGRTDIYALGCVLYEMLAGGTPFPGPSVDAVIAQRLAGPAPPITRGREDVSVLIDAAVAKALARNPEERFAKAADFAAALAPGEAGATEPRAGAGRRRALLAAGLALLALSALALWRGAHGGSAPAGDPRLMAVLPFRVAGADPSLGYLRLGMMDLLAARFTGEGGARAADVQSVLLALGDQRDTTDRDLPAESAEQVAGKVGAGLLLQGTVVGAPRHLVISASLTGRSIRSPARVVVEGPSDSLLVLADQLARQVLTLSAGAGTQLSSLTTTSLDALRPYLDGQAAYRRGDFRESIRLFERALELDSSFALAAAALMKADSWSEYPRHREMAQLAWRLRARLSERDRAVLQVRLGPRYPRWSPAGLGIDAAEHATHLTPESAETWFELGDRLFHQGELAGLPDARHRAEVMLRRALVRDSLYGPALGHLVSLVAERGDTAEVARLVPRLLAIDTAGWPSFAARWRLVAMRGDPRAIADFVAALERRDPNAILNFSRDELSDSIGAAHLDDFLGAAHPRVVEAPERELYAEQAWIAATNRGHPGDAAKWADSTDQQHRRYLPILGWLAGGDTAGMGSAVIREQRLVQGKSEPPGYPSASFLIEAAKLFHKDLSSVDRTVAALRRDPALRDSLAESHLACAQLLEAWGAVERGSADARRLLDQADSMLVGRVDFLTVEGGNWLVAYLYDRLGAPDRALVAIRRRLYISTYPWPAGMAETSRLEGRWAAATGDRRGAVQAYHRYLMWRTDPAPEKLAQRDSVRSELARLE